MFQSILLAKLLLLLCIKSSVILARDRAPGEIPDQQTVIRPQSEVVQQNPLPVVEGCFMIVFEASGLPRTQSGILELFANKNPPEGLKEIYQFVAVSKRIRDDHFKRINDEQKKIENDCREFLRFKFIWGTLTPHDIQSPAALNANQNDYTYFAFALEIKYLIENDPVKANSLLKIDNSSVFLAELDEVIKRCNNSLEAIEKLKESPESRVASFLPESPVNQRHSSLDYFF